MKRSSLDGRCTVDGGKKGRENTVLMGDSGRRCEKSREKRKGPRRVVSFCCPRSSISVSPLLFIPRSYAAR